MEHGIATVWIVVITALVVAGGGGIAYAVTDGFGTKTPEKTAPTAKSTAATDSPSAAASDGPSASSPAPEASALPTNLPDGFPDIGVPFYSPAKQMAAHAGGDRLWVLEYVTSDPLAGVNVFFEREFLANNWRIVNQNVEGQKTVFKAKSQGYLLILVVVPERGNGAKTSIHYTLRKQ